MRATPITKLTEENQTLRKKNTYFTTEVPKLKVKLDKLTLLLKEQEETHRKEMNAINHELLKSTGMRDQLQRDYDIVSGLKMKEMIEGCGL